jgi:hypothetical protein
VTVQFFNHYSATILGAVLLVGGLSLVWRRGGKLTHWLILGGVTVALGAAWWVFRPVAMSVVPAAGLPLLLEVQSPYCLGCVAIKPAVDRQVTPATPQVRSFHQAHAEIVLALVFANFVDRHDVRMGEAGRRFGFGFEPLDRVRSRQGTGADQLERDRPVETHLFGLENDSSARLVTIRHHFPGFSPHSRRKDAGSSKSSLHVAFDPEKSVA